MSAFIVSRAHIGVLVEAAFRYEIPLPPITPTALGQQLWDENILSVRTRYPDDRLEDLPGPCDERPYHYTYTQTPAQTAWVRDPWAVLSLVHGYQYQSCEHATWEQSEAWRITTDLHAAARRALGRPDTDTTYRATPQWAAAPWSL
jgi:hypothetical protein